MKLNSFYNNKPLVITIVGNSGSGKSTQINRLAQLSTYNVIQADEFYKINPFFPLQFKDMSRWGFSSDLWFLKERVKLQKEKIKMNTINIIDSGLVMNFAYVQAKINGGFYNKEERNLYLDYQNILVKPSDYGNLIINLSTKVENLRERIVKRGRAIEVEHHSLDYLLLIEKGLTDVLSNYIIGCEIQEIKTDNLSEYQVFEKITKLIEKYNESSF